MKNLYLFIFIILTYVSYSQVTIDVGHCPRIGDTFVFAIDTTLYSPKPITGGVYDFSDLKLHDSTHFYYIANDSLMSQPTANLKLKIDTNEQTATYFKKSGNDVFVIALANIGAQLPLPIAIPRLKGTLKYFSFPLTSVTNITTNDKIDITIPASFIPPQFNIDSLLSNNPNLPSGTSVVLDSFIISLNFDLKLSVDGYGKINTPIDNNLDVLKLVRKITVTPKIFMNGKATFGGFTIPLTNQDVTSLLIGALPIQIPDITTHSYYSPAFRQEIINAVVDSMGNYQAVNYRYRTKNGPNLAHINTLNNQEIDIQFLQNQIQVNGLQPSIQYLLSISDLSGKKYQEKQINSIQNSINWIPSHQPFIIHINGDKLDLTKTFQLNK